MHLVKDDSSDPTAAAISAPAIRILEGLVTNLLSAGVLYLIAVGAGLLPGVVRRWAIIAALAAMAVLAFLNGAVWYVARAGVPMQPGGWLSTTRVRLYRLSFAASALLTVGLVIVLLSPSDGS